MGFSSSEESKKHICRYDTQISVTGDVSSTPEVAILRATLLFLAQNIDSDKVPQALEALTGLIDGSERDWPAAYPSAAAQTFTLPAPIAYRLKEHAFFDDDI